MPRHNARLASPISPSRTTSIRKLTNILRPSRSAPRPDHDSTSPPSSPSLYSLSSESESRSKLTDGLSEEEPLLSPSLSTSASGEHGDYLARKPPPLELDTAGLELNVDHDRLLNSPTRPAPRPQRTSADFSWAMNKRVRPQRIIIADKEDGYITSDASSLRAGGIWDAPPVVTPSEWLASTRKGMVFQEVSSPLSPDGTSSSGSSPATPRVRPTSEMHRNVKPGAQVDSAGHSPSITGAPSPQRARSSSEPQRLFLGKNSPTSSSPHASTVPTTPTGSRSGFITPDATELVASSPPPPPPPPPPPSSLSSPITPRPKARMPDDVYFTAAGRRESRMYISPDAAPNHGQQGQKRIRPRRLYAMRRGTATESAL
ncbi:hypothetical protein C8F01DRAFT_259763 [Mycena amicta]|nr:hypothetical protein C8F01DRAFT_259763 [Mycena amicta]